MDITDALDIYLTSKVKTEEWKTEFVGKFYRPLAELMLVQAMTAARDDRLFDQDVLNQRLSPQAQQALRGEQWH